MAFEKPERFVVSQESPDVLGFTTRKAAAVTYTGNVFGNSFRLVGTDTVTKTSLKTTQPKIASLTAAPAVTSLYPPILTNTVITGPLGGKRTIFGSIIPMTTRDAKGNPIKSGIANAFTTIPIEPTPVAALQPGNSVESFTTSYIQTSTAAPASSPAESSSSKGLSSGQLAAAVVVPILVVLIGAVLGFFALRWRKQRRQTTGEKTATTEATTAPGQGAETAGTGEKRQVEMPYITSTTQNNYNTGLDSMPPSTTSGSGLNGTQTAHSALPLYARNQQGGSNLSNPFTDGSGASSSRKGSDMFAGFSGVGTDRSSSGYSTKGRGTPARAVSPVPEGETKQANRHENHDSQNNNNNNNHNDNDDAVVSDMSDIDDDDMEADVQVAQAHMGRAHRASVITMRGMTGASNSPATSPTGSPPEASVLRDA